jgi:ubiquinone/menaquinone biosynthesis C-methylase UbiE
MENFNQTWWDKNLESRLNEFIGWVGDENRHSKVFIRKYVISKAYKSLVDLGCGTASEFFGYKKDYPELKYLGVDSSSFLNKRGMELGVPMLRSNIENVNLLDSSYEVAFSRHVLEHQPSYKNGLNELIRIASKEAIHVFFIPPQEAPEHIDYNATENLYNNRYNLKDIENYIKNNKKVKSFDWIDCSANGYNPEVALCIKVL